MSEPKPISKERREEIEADFNNGRILDSDWTRELLAAEQFWREAVKNAHPGGRCSFCGTVDNGLPHKAECPYELAQEDSK